MTATTKETKQARRKTKRNTVTNKLRQMTLLGEIITWNARSSGRIVYHDVRKALAANGFDEELCSELHPRSAFKRAAAQMQTDRQIDFVHDNDVELVFQFTKKALHENNGKSEIEFAKECFVRVNKTSGEVTSKNKEIRERAQALLNEAMEARNTSDITKIVQGLFEKNADLFPVRDQGGVYFVPNEFAEFTGRVESFLQALGGELNRWPIPAGTDSGDRAVSGAIADAMTRLIEEHTAAVEEFSLETRHSSIEQTAERIKQTRVKIEAYASYLSDKSAAMLEEVGKANAKLQKRVESLTKERAKMPAISEDGKFVFGHRVTAVIRWMGTDAWSFAEARDAFMQLGVPVADATIRTQLAAGRNGQRGLPAELSKAQIGKLTKAAKAGKKAREAAAETAAA